MNLWESVPSDVVPALVRLRGLGLRLAVISNANGTLHAVFERLGLTSRFDAVLDSCDEGCEKPDARLFQIGLERVGGRAETTLPVGDIYHVGVARLELGVTGCERPVLRRGMSPDAGEAIGLQLDGDRRSLDPHQILDVMTELVGDDIRLREIARRAEASRQFVEEAQVEVHL